MKKTIKKILLKYFNKEIIKRKFPNNTIIFDTTFWNIFQKIYNEGNAIITIRELYNIYTLIRKTDFIDGEIAEVGVYRGGSAKLIAEFKGNRKLHLFDTFDGMPGTLSKIDKHKQGDFSDTSLESVKNYLSGYNDVYFYKGYFPDSIRGTDFDKKKFSFVNLDVDIYESTKNSLEFFYHKLSKGGILISHDYRSISCPGVKKAIDEFFSDKPETIIELWDTQCLIVKL